MNGHGDHWFGIGALLERFPNARALATPNVVRVMRQHASPELLERIRKASFPGQIPDHLVIAEELKGIVIDLEGHDLVAVETRPCRHRPHDLLNQDLYKMFINTCV